MEGSASPRKPSVEMASRSFDVAQLAGGVALEGEQRIVAQHAAAIVDDADQPPAAALDLDADIGRSRIERVFEQFLDHGGGPLHHLAGGDLVGDLVGENADAAHEPTVYLSLQPLS